MYIHNTSKRIRILGDRTPLNVPIKQRYLGTRIMPGESVALADIPEHVRERTMLCLERELAKETTELQLVREPVKLKSPEESERKARAKALSESQKLLASLKGGESA